MSVKLSEYHINSLIKKLENVDRDMREAKYDIVNELASEGEQVATVLNAAAVRSGKTESQITHERGLRNKEENRIRAQVKMQGPHAIFEEFGTGEVGKTDPHPKSDSMSFTAGPYSGYITGPFVSSHINKYGRHYWFNRPMRGQNDYFAENGYTEGIPSGKQMYKTARHLDKIKYEVATKHLNEFIKELNKVLNEFE